ncbi:c-type lectin domain-containing protein [Caerostris extrusa]|uniref:C-type lectin domain-containing protein n=1 Tax=Caerostris extrusa TaxID=172846 RepID=A0AAV4MPA3_CAEEX|nr:c-type lectin domain-containing protein [Caerostris extrusa]
MDTRGKAGGTEPPGRPAGREVSGLPDSARETFPVCGWWEGHAGERRGFSHENFRGASVWRWRICLCRLDIRRRGLEDGQAPSQTVGRVREQSKCPDLLHLGRFSFPEDGVFGALLTPIRMSVYVIWSGRARVTWREAQTYSVSGDIKKANKYSVSYQTEASDAQMEEITIESGQEFNLTPLTMQMNYTFHLGCFFANKFLSLWLGFC